MGLSKLYIYTLFFFLLPMGIDGNDAVVCLKEKVLEKSSI